MSREMTNKEAIANLNHIYGIVSSDIQRSLDLAIKALEERPQGDLISRSEAEKLGATCLARRNENGQLEAIISLDNAPTVNIPNYGGKVVPDTLQGWRYEKRQQGEWIDYDNTFYKCPDCGYLLEKCCPQCQNKVILPKGGAE